MLNITIKNRKDIFESDLSKIFLPVILREICSCTPKHRRSGMMMALMPIISIYANRLRLKYVKDTGKITAPTLQCYVFGPSSVGKGKVDEYQEFLSQKIQKLDAAERAKEEAYLAEKRRGGNSKKGEAPECTVMIFPEKTTSFMMVQRAMSAMRKYNNDNLLTYQFSAELKSIIAAHKSEFIDIDSLLCKGYDLESKTGAETGNIEAARGLVDINLSVCYCCTENILYKFFVGDSLTAGALNRAILIPFNGKRGNYLMMSDEQKTTISNYLDLMLANIFDSSGNLMPTFFLDTAFLDPHIEKFISDIETITDSPLCKAPDTIDEFSARASVSGFRVAALCLYLYKLEQQNDKENALSDQEIEQNVISIYKFATYYTLNNTLDKFGHKHHDVILQNRANQAYENEFSDAGLYDFLDGEFTYRELTKLMEEMNQISDPKNRISQWKTQNLIVEITPGVYQKIIEEEDNETKDKGHTAKDKRL